MVLAQELMDQLAHDEHVGILPLGDEGQLAVPEVMQQQHRVHDVQVVADQQETAFLRRLLQALGMYPGLHQFQNRFHIYPRYFTVKRTVIFLFLVKVHPLAHDQQEQKGQNESHQISPSKRGRQHPQPGQSRKGVEPEADSGSSCQRNNGNSAEKHKKFLQS